MKNCGSRNNYGKKATATGGKNTKLIFMKADELGIQTNWGGHSQIHTALGSVDIANFTSTECWQGGIDALQGNVSLQVF